LEVFINGLSVSLVELLLNVIMLESAQIVHSPIFTL